MKSDRRQPPRNANTCAGRHEETQGEAKRYAAGTREILECYFAGKPIRTEYLVVDKGKLAGVGAHSYTAGDATKGSEEAAKFKK